MLLMLSILFVIFVGVVVFLQNNAKKERQERMALRRAERQAASERRKAMMAGFLEQHMAGWLHVSSATIDDKPAMVGISNAGDIHIKFYTELEDAISPIGERTCSQQDIISFDIEIPETTRIVTRTDKVPISVKQKRSTVGRALVGGVILGPVGAVVGAASGLNGKEGVTYHQVKRRESITSKGSPRLVLGIRDAAEPKLVICFEPANLAQDWWYRIQSVRS